jgi:hypothetical protein
MQGLLYRTRCAGDRLDTILLKKAHGPAPHPAAQHHLNLMTVDKGRYLSGPMAVEKGIVNGFDGFDRVLLYLSNDEIGAAAKVVADCTFQSSVIVGRNGDTLVHHLFFLSFKQFNLEKSSLAIKMSDGDDRETGIKEGTHLVNFQAEGQTMFAPEQ